MKLGAFVEFDLSVKNLEEAPKYYERLGFKSTKAAAAAFWQKLGFEKMHESDIPYPWGWFF